MKYSDIIKNIDDIFDYFKFHSKNLTKTQEYKLDDLIFVNGITTIDRMKQRRRNKRWVLH